MSNLFVEIKPLSDDNEDLINEKSGYLEDKHAVCIDIIAGTLTAGPFQSKVACDSFSKEAHEIMSAKG